MSPQSTSSNLRYLCPYFDTSDRELVTRIRRRGILADLEIILYCAVRGEQEKRRRQPRPDQVVSL